MRIRRWLRTLGASAAAVLCYAAFGSDRAAAQQCVEDTCDTAPPLVTVTPAGATFVSATAPQVTVRLEACDAYTLGTHTVTWRGTNVTSSWPGENGGQVPPATCKNHLGQAGAGAWFVSQETLTLEPGSNTFRADMCDERGNCNWKIVTWVWDNNLPPTVSFTPTTSPADTMVTAAVAFADDAGLNWTTRSISINGVVDNGFTTSGTTSTAGTYTKTFRLVRGRNVVRATITDVGGKTKTDSIVYVRGEFAPRVTIATPAWRTQADSVQLTVTVQDSGQMDIRHFRLGVNGRVVGGYTTANTSPTVRTYTGYVKLALGENAVEVEACDEKSLCGRADSTVVRHNGLKVKPTLSLAYDPASASAGGATLGYATAPYVSMDVPRNVALYYASGQARPRAMVLIDAASHADPAPVKMSLSLRTPANATVAFSGGATELFYAAGNGVNRLSGEFATDALATGRYAYKAIVRTWFPGDATPMEDTITAPVIVINEANSAVGAGWSIAGFPRAYVQTDGVLLTDGSGNASFYAGACTTTCTFTSPAGDFSTLALAAGTYTHTFLGGSKVTYAGSGLPIWVHDAQANVVQFGYDAGSRLATITDPAGKVITLAYNGSGRLTSITDPAGRASTFSINTAVGTQFNNLTVAYDADGVPGLQGFYDSNHRLTYSVDRAGARTDVAYHAQYASVDSVLAPARNTTDGAALRPVTEFRSLQEASMPSTANGTSTTPAPRVRPSGLWLRVRNASGDSSTFVPGMFGVIRYRDQKGRVGWSMQDAHGRDTLSVSPLGDTLRYAYTGPDLTQVTRRRWGRDENEHYGVLTDIVVAYEYDASHRVTREWGQRPQVKYRYNPQGLVDSVFVEGSGAWSTYTYDSRGRLLSSTDAGGHATSQTYHATGFQNTATSTSVTGTTSFAHDAFGRVTTVTGPTGLVSRMAYDTLNRVRWASNPASDTVRSTYGGWNGSYLTTITDPRGQAYQFRPNILGADTLQSDPDGVQRTMRYDRRGNVAVAFNGRDTLVTHFDARGRPDTLRVNGVVRTTLAYDSAGLTRVVTNGESIDSVRTDTLGGWVRQVTVRNGRAYIVTRTNDLATRLPKDVVVTTDQGDADRSMYLYYGYDTNRRLISVRVERGTANGWNGSIAMGTFKYAYDSEGQVRKVIIPTDLAPGSSTTHSDTLQFGYTEMHGLQHIQYSRRALDSIAGAVMTRDSLGRLVRTFDAYTDTARYFGYGPRGDLTSYRVYEEVPQYCQWEAGMGEQCSTSSSVLKRQFSYTYDRTGNPTYESPAPTLTPGNRLTQFRGYSMTYDTLGNLTRRWKTGVSDLSYYWNGLGQLDSVRNNVSGVTVAKFGYDGLGRRVRRTINGVTTGYVYDGDNIVMELDGAGNPIAFFAHQGVDNPLAMLRGDSIFYYLKDQLGSVVGVMRKRGSIVSRFTYDPWGAFDVYSDSVQSRYTYTAREFEPQIGLYYYRARWYDPVLRRFISKDPIGLEGGINPYAYVGNDPVNATDPSGLQAVRDNCERRGNFLYCPGKSPIMLLEPIEAFAPRGPRFVTDRKQSPAVGLSSLGPAANQANNFAREREAACGRTVVALDCAPYAPEPLPPVPAVCLNTPAAPPGASVDENMKTASALVLLGGANVVPWYFLVRNKGPWDYKQRGREYADFGNFNYGAAGTAAGLDEEILLRAAGVAQVRSGNTNPAWSQPWGSPPYGDDPIDGDFIRAGVAYADAGCNMRNLR
jgi:RHS repeat-associated protein